MKKRVQLEKFPKLGSLLKKHFLAGLFVVIPLGVITWIVVGAVGAAWRLHQFLPETWRPDHLFSDPLAARLFNLLFTFGAVLLLALGISILGWISRQYLGQKILDFIGEIIQRIPVIRSIYSALDQLLKTFASDGSQQFHRVVYVEYPRKGIWALAFVTSTAKASSLQGKHLNVYVPTTPNPTSGFHLIVPESEVRDSHMKVDEAFRTILSLGIVQSDSSSHDGG